jgi:membrane associated rhomboid family serine protease
MIPIRDRIPTRTFPIVNSLLIAVNVLAFVFEGSLVAAGYGGVVSAWGLVPGRLMADPVVDASTLLTSMFMHGGLGHLGGNMLYLYIFGDNVEDAVGHLRYLLFYLLAGLGAAAAQIAIDPTSAVPMVGASGAIAGVLAAYVSLYPRSPITVINPVFPLWFFIGIFLELPAFVVIVLFFFVPNLLNGVGSLALPTSGGVAFFAHVGGFVAGLVLVRLFMIGRERQEADRWSGWRPPARRPRPEPWDGFRPSR